VWGRGEKGTLPSEIVTITQQGKSLAYLVPSAKSRSPKGKEQVALGPSLCGSVLDDVGIRNHEKKQAR